MPSVLVGVDGAGKVTQWNQEAEKFTGIPAHSARGQTLAQVFPWSGRGNGTGYGRPLREGRPLKNAKVPRHRDGEQRFVDLTIYPLVTNGGAEGAVIRLDDVTERVRMEEMMIQSEKMLSVGGAGGGHGP